jgi:lactoylglutathione lyase
VIRQLRLVVTAEDYDEAVAFYRDVLGMGELAVWVSPDGGHVTLLDAGRATLEITDPKNAAHIDEVEVGRRVARHIRVALEVDDSRSTTAAAVEGGAELLAEPTETPWRSLNARLEAPGALQLTLFEELGPDSALGAGGSAAGPSSEAQ